MDDSFENAARRQVVIAVDFDGTCVDHRYPQVGPSVPGAADVLRELAAAGHQLIIWTMRDGQYLEDAKAWWDYQDIPYFGANRNPDQNWSSSPKAYAHIYIDDAALGCPLVVGHPEAERPFVDWVAVRRQLVDRGVL